MKKLLCCLGLFALLSGCATPPSETGEGGALLLKPAGFESLPGFENDDLSGFMRAYENSCRRIMKKEGSSAFSSDPSFGTYGDWQQACRKAVGVDASSAPAIRAFLKENFRVVQATAAGDPEGLFTGYYVSTLHGSRTRHGVYQHPLLARPSDLVMVELGDFRTELKGQRIAGRVIDGKLKPYESRSEIMAGKMPDQQFRPLVWLDDQRDAFFVQVQGSGNVHLDDGGTMQVGYDGQNGHAYYAIGRELVKRGILPKEQVSMDSIRGWLENNPGEAEELMNTNPSFVFFREMPDGGGDDAAVGGEGVKLTAERSLAIDRSIIPYGMPVYLAAVYNDSAGTPIRRLMMTQDTGGAIRGAVRGDYFWGSGERAEKMAGPMKAKGGYFFLLPKSVP